MKAKKELSKLRGKAYLEKNEELFMFHVKSVKLPKPEREYRFHGIRRFRFDFAWPEQKLAVECEGGVWTGGRHTQGAGYQSDCEKYNLAVEDGWRVLRYTGDMIKSGRAIEQVERFFQ